MIKNILFDLNWLVLFDVVEFSVYCYCVYGCWYVKKFIGIIELRLYVYCFY